MIKLIFSLVFIVFFYCSCVQQVKTGSPAGYDLSRPEVLKMPSGLNELSGIAFNKGNPDTIYAEQDEEGRLFYFAVASLDVQHKKFGKKGDYEDVAVCKDTVVILRSDGVLFSFPLNVTGDGEIGNVQESASILPAGEYEGMYGDEATGELYVLCKNCNADNAAKSTSGYILQMGPANGIALKSSFQVNTKDIAAKMNEKKIVFRPSALAKSSRNNEWWLLSSVNKLLVITDGQWVVKEVYPLDPAVFIQPEGIAFDRDGNLYISNERGSAGNATILKFIFGQNKK